VLSRHPARYDVIAKSNMAATGHDENPNFCGSTCTCKSGLCADNPRYAGECGQTLQGKMCNLKVHMATRGQNKVVYDFLMQESVLRVVLHLHVHQEPKKLGFASWQVAAILDLAITSYLAGWRESTSVIFHVQVPTYKNKVRNPPNTIF